MRRLPRILLNAATVASLAMCVACLAVWPVTARTCLAVRYVRDGGTGYQLATAPRGIELSARENFQATNEGLTPVPAGGSATSYPWGTVESREASNAIIPPAQSGVPEDDFSFAYAFHIYREPEHWRFPRHSPSIAGVGPVDDPGHSSASPAATTSARRPTAARSAV